MKYAEYLKQFEGRDCYIKRDPDNDGMTVFFYSTQPDKTHFVQLQKVYDDFVVFINSTSFDEDISYKYLYTCPLNLLYMEVEEIVQVETE